MTKKKKQQPAFEGDRNYSAFPEENGPWLNVYLSFTYSRIQTNLNTLVKAWECESKNSEILLLVGLQSKQNKTLFLPTYSV